MNFEEFLKEEKKRNIRCGGTGEVILVEDLGEWAWTFVKKGAELNEITFYDFDKTIDFEPDTCWYSYYEIAVACLGKKEIEKRLKELKEE